MKFSLSGNDWKVAHMLPCEANPATDVIDRITKGNLYGPDWIRATVPGDVQSDALDAGLIPPIEYGFNARMGEWTYQRDWVYYKTFSADKIEAPFKRAILEFDGVDYACDVFLNGKWLGYHEVAWKSFSYDVTDKLNYDKENALIVIVKNAPEAECQWGRTSAVKHLKPRFAYGWDWCTRMVPIGIWRDVSLRYAGGTKIENVWVRQDVDYEKLTASITVEPNIESTGNNKAKIQIEITAPNCEKTTEEYDIDTVAGENKPQYKFDIKNPELWYPNGYGKQPLYNVLVKLVDGGKVTDEKNVRIGLRKIEWLKNDGADESAISYIPKVNGKRIYLKGYNVVPVRQLYGRVHKDIYKRRNELAKRAGANFLRIWGGGLAEREEFYDLCDEMGILLLQELFESSATIDNHPPMNDEFINLLLDTAEAVIKEKRNHASLAVWCGGNELCTRDVIVSPDGEIKMPEILGLDGYIENTVNTQWIPVTEKFPTLLKLGELVKKTDPDRKWIHTSGSGPFENSTLDNLGRMHDVHGPWKNLGPDMHCSYYNKMDMFVHMEFGCDGAASMQALNDFMPKDMMWPLDSTNSAAWYHGRMWTIDNMKITEGYFGEADGVLDYVPASRFLQADGLSYAIESHRRRKWQSSGGVIWHMMEPWPNASDTCIVDFYTQPKPAYYAVARAFRPVHISAQYDTVAWGDKEFSANIFLHNSGLDEVAVDIEYKLLTFSGKELFNKKMSATINGESSLMVAKTPQIKLPDEICILRCAVYDKDGNELSVNNSVHSACEKTPYEALKKLNLSKLNAKIENDTLRLKNEGSSVITGLFVETPLTQKVFFDDNFITLLPGEERVIKIDGDYTELYIEGYGCQKQTIKK